MPVYIANLTAVKRVGQPAAAAPQVPIAIATVSMNDLYSDTNARDEVLSKCKAALPAPVFERINWFYLRGGLDYERMRFTHRMLMRMMYGMAQRHQEG
ncbi:hypothetical protein [uncultured Gulosibacter sp.]|uniref:hypothetical protein n=1 Tax=uncultured Gulosibacter sp. TaxID=1339167 RepID=UPI002889EBBE|nr:hypothetical protein [uncultured Gulosibacter sp.]